MASTNLETSRQRTPSSSNGVESRRPRLLTATETRRSFMTSEFWITIVMAVTTSSSATPMTTAWASTARGRSPQESSGSTS